MGAVAGKLATAFFVTPLIKMPIDYSKGIEYEPKDTILYIEEDGWKECFKQVGKRIDKKGDVPG